MEDFDPILLLEPLKEKFDLKISKLERGQFNPPYTYASGTPSLKPINYYEFLLEINIANRPELTDYSSNSLINITVSIGDTLHLSKQIEGPTYQTVDQTIDYLNPKFNPNDLPFMLLMFICKVISISSAVKIQNLNVRMQAVESVLAKMKKLFQEDTALKTY